ncbi:MAG: DUF4397 domain-containing protein [Bacteroidota bacterium]
MKIFSTISIMTLLTIFLFTGCKKITSDNVFSDYTIVDGSKALLKVNYNVAFYNDPLVQLKINGVRVSGTNIQTRYPFPGGGFNTLGGSTGDYLPVEPGSTAILLSIPKKGTSVDSIEIYKTTLQTAAGKKYSLHVTDTLSRKSLAVEEDAAVPDSGFVRYRFTNLMANVPAIDLYVGSVIVASNIPFLGISEKFTLPTSQTGISTIWTIRPAGALPTSTALATYNSASTFLSRRVYTVFASGYAGNTDTKRKPYVSFYYVR